VLRARRDRVRGMAGVRPRRLAGGARRAPRAARARRRRRAGDRVILGLDISTAATAAAVWEPGGRSFEARDDPGPEQRPQHASRLLALVEEALAGAGAGWQDV